MNDFWKGLPRGSRWALVVGFLVIAVAMAVSAWWAFRVDYQVLFADLKPQDALAMTSELDKQKIPYRIDDGGSTILVDKHQVHATRIKLMGKEIPLQGAVGFELFNNTDFGMTEFAQKINYQRALQGELTRTILSLAEVSDVRVHLALPEQGLFKQATSKPKAAINLTLRQGQNLRAEQVFGIQHLVAAATPGMTPGDVTVVNHQGIALSRAATQGEETGSSPGGSGRLDLKKETETYLSRKVGLVLDQAFGQGQALASVDVILNMDQIRTTTEDVIAAPSRDGKAAAGVAVREREVMRDTGVPPLDARTSNLAGSSVQREVDYQVGKRIEQVVSQPGSIRRIQVVAVVRKMLDSREEDQLRKLVAAAVGASLERGDTVVIQSLVGTGSSAPAPSGPLLGGDAPDRSPANSAKLVDRKTDMVSGPIASICALLLCLLAALVVWRFTRRETGPARHQQLDEAQRQAALRQIREWMEQKPTSGAP